MAIEVRSSKLHWNYFLALESDLVRAARFIEFREENFATYSIELARLLMSAAAEVDVVAKIVCQQLSPSKRPKSIGDYAAILLGAKPSLRDVAVLIPPFGLTLKPWSSWTHTKPPVWWSANNKVKHQRNTHFSAANLQNALNAVAALYAITVFHYALEKQLRNAAVSPRAKVRNFLDDDQGRQYLRNLLQPQPQLFVLRSRTGDVAEYLGHGGLM